MRAYEADVLALERYLANAEFEHLDGGTLLAFIEAGVSRASATTESSSGVERRRP